MNLSTTLRLGASLALLAGLSLSQANAATLFDSFTVNQSLDVSGTPMGTLSGFNALSPSGSIGGTRKFNLTRTSNNAGSVDLDSNLSDPGALSFSEGNNTTGIGTITFDGTTANALNPIGLRNGGPSGIDITVGGATGIVLFGEADGNGGLQVVYTAYTDATHFSTYAFNVSGNPGGGNFNMYFAPFTLFTPAGSGGGFDPTNLGAFVFSLTGGSPANDGSVDLVGAGVPEPGSVAMLVGMGISGSVFAFRLRRKRA